MSENKKGTTQEASNDCAHHQHQSSSDENKGHGQHEHSHHHDQDHSHDHGHTHDHSHAHDHEHCQHDHDHGHCHHHHGHAHTSPRPAHVFSESELKKFQDLSMDELMEKADHFLSLDDFGKVVPIFEIALSKKLKESPQEENFLLDLTNIQQNLAFSYGIIGDHQKALPLWAEVISYKEKNQGDPSDLLDDYFGVALSCEQCQMETEFLTYIEKGLKLAKESKFEEYEASFEHELGGFYCDRAQFEKAETHLRTAIDIREKLEDIVGLAMSKMYLGILFEEQKKYGEAKSFYEKALELTKTQGYLDDLKQEREEIEFRLSQIQNTNLKGKLTNF